MAKNGRKSATSGKGSAGRASPTFSVLQKRAVQVAEQVKGGLRLVGKQATQKAHEAADALSDEALRLVEERKGRFINQVDLVASAAHQAAKVLRTAQLAKTGTYFDNAAQALDGLTEYLEEGDVRQLIGDAAALARRHPALAAASVLVIGLAIGRFLAAGRTTRSGRDSSATTRPLKRTGGRPSTSGGKPTPLKKGAVHHAKSNGTVSHTSSRREKTGAGKPNRLAG